MDLEYINIIQESCEDMAAIFDYDNNYTLARPYLQEAEEQKEGIIKRGIGAIIRFCQRIYRWFSEKIGIIKEAIKKKLFNNNKVIAAAAEKQLEKEEAKASSQPAAKPAQPTTKTEPKQAPVKQFNRISELKKKIFNVIRNIIKVLRSDRPDLMRGAGYGPYRNFIPDQDMYMDTYDFYFGSTDTGIIMRTANIVSDMEYKVENVLDSIDKIKDELSDAPRETRDATILTTASLKLNRGFHTLIERPIEKKRDNCFHVLDVTTGLLSVKDVILNNFKTNDLNKLSRILDKGLKKKGINNKDTLKCAHNFLLEAFKGKQIVFNKITTILDIAAEQYTMSAKKVLGSLFQLSRKV